jgi:prepilin peptidase CpaA
MLHAILNDMTVCIFALLVAAAAYHDVKNFTIPNIFSLSIVLIYPAFVMSSSVEIDWLSAAGVASTALITGFALFVMKFCGGGDAKLFAAASLWAGPSLILDFTFLMGITGGVIVIFLWLLHCGSRTAPFLSQGVTSNTEPFRKRPMPYGVAIAVGAIYVAFILLR